MGILINTGRERKQERKDIVYGAKSHIHSIQVALDKYLKGSPSERGYALEHAHKLIEYYLNKL